MLLEAADVGYLDYNTIDKNLGGDVAMLVRDVSVLYSVQCRDLHYECDLKKALVCVCELRTVHSTALSFIILNGG